MNAQEMINGLDALYEKHQPKEVEQYLIDCRAVAISENNTELLITVLNEMSGFYRNAGKFSNAISSGEEALALIKDSLGETSYEYLTALGNVATAYREIGEYEKAIDMYLFSLEKSAGQDIDQYVVATLHNNLGNAYLKDNQIEKALLEFRAAIDLDKTLSESEGEQAITFTAIANAYLMMNDVELAEENLAEAVRLFRISPYEHPHYASTLVTMGQVVYSQGKYEQALDLFNESLQVINKFFGKNQNYIYICKCCSKLCDILGREEESKSYLDTAVRAEEELSGSSAN